MSDFYSKWLGYWADEEKERREARIAIHEEDLRWVRTAQDREAALICDRSLGFLTTGSAIVAKIPQGWHTGKHSHGEEAIYILEGSGCSVIDGKRYDWDKGSCLFIPFGSVHQHYNTGDEEVKYFSIMELELERFAGLAKIIHLVDAGETHLTELEEIKQAESDIHPEYGRILLKSQDTAEVPWSGGDMGEGSGTAIGVPFQHLSRIPLMGGIKGNNDFKPKEVTITWLMNDPPGGHGGKHAHMEALIYIFQGEGYSIVDGEKINWKKGSLLHIHGPQTSHQHFNTGRVQSMLLRANYGLRHYYEGTARTFPKLLLEYSEYGFG